MGLVQLIKEYWSAWKHAPKERGKLILGYLIFPRATHRWLSYLSNHAPLRALAWEYPQLVTRIYRPYALRELNCHERVVHMIEHHDTLRQTGWSHLTNLSFAQPIEILQWFSRDSDVLKLQLFSF